MRVKRNAPSISVSLLRVARGCASRSARATARAFAAEPDAGERAAMRAKAPGHLQLSVGGGDGAGRARQARATLSRARSTSELGPRRARRHARRRCVPRQADPRSPPASTPRSTTARPNAHLAADETKRVVVTWTPGKRDALKELYGHVVVESNSARSTDPRAMGIHAELPSPAPLALPAHPHLADVPARCSAWCAHLLWPTSPATRTTSNSAGSRWSSMGVNLALAVWLYFALRPQRPPRSTATTATSSSSTASGSARSTSSTSSASTASRSRWCS